ncbi:MAG: branched-chain amino acid transport system substrate-binding protein, partial [Micromonosporaceae bacterium]|nr:branched-chain amino acid transport system substrate-binding protein [Micromonosporaceae bacterium]
MRQGLTRAIGGVGIVVLLAGAAACNKSTKSDTAGGANCGFSLAYVGALTGSSANLGVNIEQGAELAVDQYNAKNGKGCVTLKKFDSQGAPEVAPGVARQAITDQKLLGVVG